MSPQVEHYGGREQRAASTRDAVATIYVSGDDGGGVGV